MDSQMKLELINRIYESLPDSQAYKYCAASELPPDAERLTTIEVKDVVGIDYWDIPATVRRIVERYAFESAGHYGRDNRHRKVVTRGIRFMVDGDEIRYSMAFDVFVERGTCSDADRCAKQSQER